MFLFFVIFIGDSQKLLRENVMYFLAKIDYIELKKFALNAYLDRKNTRINADLQKAVLTFKVFFLLKI